MELTACPGCRRHVAIDEITCPFCAGELPAVEPRAFAPGRLSRAAVFAGAALVSACGGKAKPADTQKPPPPVADAGVSQPDAAAMVPDHVPDHMIPKPYGAPPARRRIV